MSGVCSLPFRYGEKDGFNMAGANLPRDDRRLSNVTSDFSGR